MSLYKSKRALMTATSPVVKVLNQVARKRQGDVEVLLPSEQTNLVPSKNGLVTVEELGDVLKQAEEARDKRRNEFSLKTNIALLRQTTDSCAAATEELVEATAKYKGLYEAGKAEERIAWSLTVQVASELRQTFEAMERGKPRSPAVTGKHLTGRVYHTVFPKTNYEHALFAGHEQEVWFAPGVTPHQKMFDEMPDPEVLTLLASGNQMPQVGGDILHVIFAENAICVCKLNPVNDYLYEGLLKAFKPLLDNGLLFLVNGSIDISQALIWAKAVKGIHMTGSDKTYEAIMWGETPQSLIDSLPDYCEKPKLRDAGGDFWGYVNKRKKEGGELNLSKPFTAELGNITPIVVTPGKWSAKSIDFHAKNLVATKVNNASFNCLAPQIVITDARWEQREEFLEAVKKHLNNVAPRAAYYPGADKRREAFIAAYKDEADIFFKEEDNEDGVLPWTLISGLDSSKFDRSSHAACTEMFGAVLTEIPLKLEETEDILAKDFLPAAVKLTQDVIWGTLCCSILLPPSVQKAIPAVCEEAIAGLKYGCVGVNVPTGLTYGLSRGTWGGHAGLSTPSDIQSGNGFVHNTMLYTNAEKTVLRVPFSPAYTPIWMHDNRNVDSISKKLMDFWRKPSAGTSAALMAAGLRG